ncbi:MAG: gamma-glutamyltransferase [bacterium]|nr:gamma-glutamyltransferase [bacterium]
MRKFAICIITIIYLTITVSASFADIQINDVYAKNAMVAAADKRASEAGVEIMKKGGNAIDAAVATALALHVVEFNASGVGGGGFMTIRLAKTGEVICLDYREMAPASATKDMFASEQSKKERWSVNGGKAVGVPGYIKGMFYALEKYGTMSFAEVAAPAIRLAENGFSVTPLMSYLISDNYEKLAEYNDVSKLPFIVNEFPIEGGKILKQPAVAKLLRLFAEKGPDVLYNGVVGEAIIHAVNNSGGSMTMEDLKNYKTFVRKPVYGTYRGYRIYSVPPASSGGTHVIQLLNIMENFDVKAMGQGTPKFAHIWAEATKLAFADRSKYMADTAYTKVPLKGLQSKEYAKTLVEKIDRNKIADKVSAGDPWKYEDTPQHAYIGGMGSEYISTTTYSVVDKSGNMVTATNTVNNAMGSKIYVPEYGIVLNNQMDDFAKNPKSVNAPEPGKRMLSSVSPSIVLTPDGKPFMSIGSAGGPRIITSVAQVLMNVIDHEMTMDEAIEQGRFFNQIGTLLRVDLGRVKQTILDILTLEGYKIDFWDPPHLGGTVQAIMIDPATGVLDGGADSRRPGAPVGL